MPTYIPILIAKARSGFCAGILPRVNKTELPSAVCTPAPADRQVQSPLPSVGFRRFAARSWKNLVELF
jgi:hypothetical protein